MSIEYVKNKIENLMISNDIEVNNKIKNILLDISQELYQQQQDLYNRLETNVFDKLMAEDIFKDLSIYTALVPTNDEYKYSNIGFFPVLTENYKKNVFLDTSYDNIMNLCNKYFGFKAIITKKDGTSYNTKYSFSINNDLVKKENIIYQISQIYNMDNSMIYSPFARKFVSIEFQDFVPSDSQVNLCAKENGLEGIILENYSLIWNISIDTTEKYQIDKSETPLFDNILYKYTFPAININDRKYVIPINNAVSITDIKDISQCKDGSVITLLKDISPIDFNIISCRKPTKDDISKLSTDNVPMFFHNPNPRILNKHRLRSIADINYVISLFNREDVTLSLDNSNDSPKINRYCQGLKYYNSVNDFIKIKSSKILNIKFSGNSKYICDYANYVLSYLEVKYPEFRWAGVLD